MSKERRSKQSPTKDRNVGCMKVKEWGQFELEKKYTGKKQQKPTVLIGSAENQPIYASCASMAKDL